MKKWTCALLACLASLLAAADINGREDELSKKIDLEWKRYQAELSGYEIRLVWSHIHLLSGKKKADYLTHVYKRRGEWKVFLEDYKDQSGVSTCSGVNSKYAFSLKRSKAGNPWELSEIDTDLSDGIQIAGVKALTEDFALIFSPYNLAGHGSVFALMQRPGFKLTKAEVVSQAGLTLTKFWFHAAPDEVTAKQEGAVPIEGDGWLLMEPNSYFRVHECELPFDVSNEKLRSVIQPRKSVLKFSYAAEPGFPLLRQLTSSTYARSDGKETSRADVDYFFEKRTPTESDFRLSAFGLPEPMIASRPTWSSHPFLWFSVAAFVFFALAFAIRRYRQSATTNK